MKKKTKRIPQEIPVYNADADFGLTCSQAKERLDGGWANGPTPSANRSEWEILLENCLTFFNLVFAVLAVILVLSGSTVKNMAFLIVVVCNTAIGCFQEIRAKRAVDKLTLVAARPVKVLRDGQIHFLPPEELVRDDIVEFSAGEQICADGIVRTGLLYVNEALITGEEDPIPKTPGQPLKSGSFVVAGTGRVQLTQVGADAFAAKLSAEAKANPQAAKSEMMRSLDRLIRAVGIALIPIGLLLFYKEFVLLELGLQKSTEGTVAALVGMIPEGLYLLTSVAVAASALKLSRKRVLVQDMNCMETLARVDVLCVDKTGTITESAMEVENIIPLTQMPPERLEQILAALYSDPAPENETAKALHAMFAKENDWVCTQKIPFTAQTKWSAATFRGQGCFVVGAPEITMGERYAELKEQVEQFSCKGYRVLLIAQYTGVIEKTPEAGKLHPLALIVLSNRIRPTAAQTFSYFAQQGVTVKVISGDHPVTVSEVTRRAGIAGAENYIDATALVSNRDIFEAAKKYTVFGRVTPEQKKKLIDALRKQGHTVAMTGDGVNDVLAMKQANCSIAMAGGAQAASQIAQLVLLDSDFAAMPGIVGEGRRVINNIQRAATLFLVKNIFSLGLSLISLLTNWPYPLMPLHLSVISALTIGVPSFFLAMEPNYERVTGHFLPTVLRKALPGGLTNIFVVLMAQAFMTTFRLPMAQTSTVCAALLGLVGLLVLWRTCQPFDRFRKLIWACMAAGLVLCFTSLAPLFELTAGNRESTLILVTLMLMTPTVFLACQKIFDWLDVLFAKRR